MTNHPLHVIFGTGPVGMAIMDELCQQDVHIRMVNRSGQTPEPLPPTVELVSGDAADPAFAIEAAQGASVIYFALNPPYHRWPELFPPLQAAVIAAAESTGAKLAVMENVYMYGDTNGQPIHEDLPHDTHTRKGQTRLQMHQRLMDAHRAGQVAAVVVRASDFYGPRVRVSAAGDTLFGQLAAGRAAQYIGDPDQPHTYTYMPDIGRAVVMLAGEPDAYGQVWHVPNAPAITTHEMVGQAAAHLGAEPKIQVLPSWLLPILGIFVKSLGEFPEMLYEFEKPFIVRSGKIEAAYGLHPTPLAEGIPATADWFAAQPR